MEGMDRRLRMMHHLLMKVSKGGGVRVLVSSM